MMKPENFRQFREQALGQYDLKNYAGALVYIDEWKDNFPEQAAHILNWRMCMQALMHDRDGALQTLSAMLDQGFFWTEAGLHHDPDLASLQGDPDFEALVQRSAILCEQAQLTSKPLRLVFTPPAGTPPPYPLLIGLHGHSSSAAEVSARWSPLAEKGWLVAIIQSSQLAGTGTYVWDDSGKAIREVVNHYFELANTYPVDTNRVVLSGFSQGAGVAAHIGLSDQIPTAGVILVAPWMAQPDSLDGPGKHRLRAFIFSGDQDPIGSVIDAIETRLVLIGVDLRRERYAELKHEFPVDFLPSLDKGLAFILNRVILCD